MVSDDGSAGSRDDGRAAVVISAGVEQAGRRAREQAVEHQPGRARDLARVASGWQSARLRPRRRHRGAAPRRGRRDAARQQAARARGDQSALADRARVGRGALGVRAPERRRAVHAPAEAERRGEGRRRRRRRRREDIRILSQELGSCGSLRPAGPAHRAGQRRRARHHRALRVRGRALRERGPDKNRRARRRGKRKVARRRRAARDGVARPLARARRVRGHGAFPRERR